MCLDRTVPALVEEHVRSAIPPVSDKLPPALVQREVATALAAVDEESPSGTALKEAISSAVSDRLATTFPAEAWVDACAQRDSTAPGFTQTHAEPIGAAPGIGTMAPHPEGWPLTWRVGIFNSHNFMVLQEGPQKMALLYSPIRLAPAGQKTAWGASRQKSDSRISRAEETHPGALGFDSEGTENPSKEETRRLHEAMRKYRDGCLG